MLKSAETGLKSKIPYPNTCLASITRIKACFEGLRAILEKE